ncbi:hypothetical protein SH139x_000020 [Planctomycetaceae bacterium SH139]
MNSSQTLTFAWTPTTLLIAITLWLITAAFSYLTWRRSGYRNSVLWLEILRLSAVALAGLLLNQPEWVETYQPADKPVVVIITDDSTSMQTRDVVNAQSTTPQTRAQTISPLSDDEQLRQLDGWQTVDEKIEIVLNAIRGDGTNLAQPLEELLARHPSLLGVVLASDGDWNQGEPPAQIASRYRTRGVPIFTIPVGSKTQLPDLELVSFDVPTFSIINKSVRIPFTIDSALPRDTMATVVMTTSTGERLEREVRIAAMSRTSDAIVWEPKETGDVTLKLEVPLQSNELIEDNNTASAPMSVREEKLRVLVIESIPRWEYRYLRNALSRDPGVEVSCLLFHPGLDKRGGGNLDYIKEFPQGKDELAEYDVVFLGDVGIDEEQLTLKQCELLKGLVEQQASGLVFMPGWRGSQFSLLESALEDLYPVTLDDLQPGGWGSRTPSHFELTELGRRSLLTKLADTTDDNIEVWGNLPGFQWYAPVVKAKPGADVLAVHSETSNQYGRLPLLVTRTFGAGKVLFMGTDGAWRWRKGVEDLYHYRFWGQVVRWMAYRRNMARGETMRFYYSPEQPQVRQQVALTANVMETNGEPLARGQVTARIVAPSGKIETVRFNSSGEAWGAFNGRFTASEPGQHQVTLRCEETSGSLETTLFIQGAPLEQIGKPARPEVLEEIARLTRGRVLRIDKLEEIQQSLATLPEPPPAIRRVQLWSNPVVAGLMILLLGGFWIGRKVVGFI